MRVRRHLQITAIAALLSGAAAPVFAQADSASRTTWIRAGTLIAVPGQPPLRDATIEIADGRIVSVRQGTIALPADARIIDLSGRTVLPGLIDSHVHLDSDRAGLESLAADMTDADALRTLEAQWNGMKTLRAGFTTVRNLGNVGGTTLALREAIRRGWTQGPRIIDAGQSISTTGGHMDGRVGLSDEAGEHVHTDNLCDGPEDCRRAVRRQIGRGADVIKFASTGGVNSGTGLATRMTDPEARAIVETAHQYGRKVAAHAHGLDGIRLAVQAGVDSIDHGTMMDAATARLMREKGTFYVPTLSTVNGYLERLAANPDAYPPAVKAQIDWRIGITGKALQIAVPAGVRIAFGTDAGVSKHGRNADEFELLVKHGMTPAEAVRAATVNAAELLGLSKEIGTIEPGKSADIIAVDGDPLADVRVLKSVKFVMVRGQPVALD